MGALALNAQMYRISRFNRSTVWELSLFGLSAGPEFQEKINHQKASAKPYQKRFKTASLELMTISHPFCVFSMGLKFDLGSVKVVELPF